MEKNELKAMINQLREKSRAAQHKTIEGQAESVAGEIRNEIAPQGKLPAQQGNLLQLCGYPTDMTRCSPFFPVAQQRMNERQYLENLLITSASWGNIRYTGPKLSVHDEDVLMAVLAILQAPLQGGKTDVEGRKTFTYAGAIYPLLKLMGYRSIGSSQYRQLLGSLKRLMGGVLTMELGSKGKSRKPRRVTMTHILSSVDWDEEAKVLTVTVHPFFYETYIAGRITFMDVIKRVKLRGAVAKALFRFMQSHRSGEWKGHFLTLAQALNMDLEQPQFTIRKLLKSAMTELRKAGIIDQEQSRFLSSETVQVVMASAGKGSESKGLPSK